MASTNSHAETTAHAAVRLLTAAEVARILRISRTSVLSLTRRGLLPSVAVLAGPERASRRWREEDVLAFVEGRVRPDTARDDEHPDTSTSELARPHGGISDIVERE